MIEVPDTLYAKTSDGAHIAYQVVGDGPLDLLLLSGASNVEVAWEIASLSRVLRRLASFSRLIRYDMRGSGLSDPFNLDELPSLEAQVADLLAVLDAAESDRAAVVAADMGALLAVFFVATYPARASSLVIDGGTARLARAPDYPWGVPMDVLETAVIRVGEGGGDSGARATLNYVAPHAARDPEFVAQFLRYSRSKNSPATRRALAEMLVFADVRAALPSLRSPTLVMYRAGDRLYGKPHATYLAEHISGARLLEVPGEDNLLFAGDNDADLDEIEEFLTGTPHKIETDRVLATVLFTDIVGSTERASQIGDRAWRELLDAHDRLIRRQLERFRGREVNTTGDGFLATFDGPGRAIQCGCAMRDAVQTLGIDVRVGLHTGEIELRRDDVAGVAVHIAARVAHHADAREVLVSSTVKDLVAGSGIDFNDRGEHVLKGLAGTWRLFAVDS